MMATCVGLFLFTRILIPDVMITFTVALAMWAFLRALEEDEPHPRFWAFTSGGQPGAGAVAEKPDRNSVSARRRRDLPLSRRGNSSPPEPGSGFVRSAEH